jgi:hypothetical protein
VLLSYLEKNIAFAYPVQYRFFCCEREEDRPAADSR